MFQNFNIERNRLRLLNQFVKMRYYLLKVINRCEHNFNKNKSNALDK